ncbi:MAG TPA: hypothetical protein VJZ27_19085 [Aggregatilineales bacterium]|nr:hypothetical protein [Aggregatilineales bacterium]
MAHENTSNDRYSAQEPLSYATNLLAQSGREAEKAMTVAEILLEADLMGIPRMA